MILPEDALAVGVDIGGARIRAGLVNRQGRIRGKSYSLPTGGSESAEVIFNRILESVRYILKENESSRENLLGIGLGVTGPLDIGNGIILECPQLPTMHNFPLRSKISDVFKIPVRMDNDANAMILGESLWGSGKGHEMVLGFTLGTGLGCAIVWNGKIHPGRRELSGEIWPSPFKEGTIEDYVSGAGISSLYKKSSGLDISAAEVGELGNKGDATAVKVWHEFGQALGFAISWTVNLLDPDIVILGGSISDSFHLFRQSALDIMQKYGCPSPVALPPVVQASLGGDAGLIGAAGLILASA